MNRHDMKDIIITLSDLIWTDIKMNAKAFSFMPTASNFQVMPIRIKSDKIAWHSSAEHKIKTAQQRN